jgi:hypothetical protein
VISKWQENKTKIKDWSSSLQLRPEMALNMGVLRHQYYQLEIGARHLDVSTLNITAFHVTALGQTDTSRLPNTDDQHLKV